MATETLIPITDLFEAHLTVSDLDRAVAFYRDQLALPLAHIFPDRKVAFFWIGAPGKAMLGLWEAGTMPMSLDPPRPDLGVLPWSDWVDRTPSTV